MKHLLIHALLWVAILLPAQAVVAAPAAARPNVVVILSDDQGWGDLSLNGNTTLSTPNIDSIAQRGASFDRFFVCPVCSPTRAEFLTGRYHPRSGIFSTSAGGERMSLDEVTIADTFKAAGYATAAFGKWHNGMQYPYHPNGRGFDEYYGFCSGHWGDYFSPLLEHNGRLLQGEGFTIDDFTNHAMQFMQQHREQPFFIYLPYNTPHSPMQVPDRWWNKFKDKPLEQHNRARSREDVPFTRAALAMCENIDWNVGRLLAKLDELKLADNTIVLYFCDNGPNGYRYNGGMKGRKGFTDEGGVRSPLVIRWPGHIPAGEEIKPIAGAIDLLPTLADLAGVPLINREPLDGKSLKPLLLKQSENWPERMIFSHWNGKVSVRTQQHRLDHQGQLFDMLVDPGQDQNIAEQQPQLAKKLQSAVTAWKQDVGVGRRPNPPFLLGHKDYLYTQVPARDGVSHGGIERSNKFPNCSYFTNWKSTDDSITWEVEVGAAGDYEVELYYACPQADVGATMELSFGKSRVSAQLTEAHNPPQRGAEHDRVERKESYIKDFKPWKLGTISLTPGPGTLTLKALEIPGSQAMEFRLLMFKRVEEASGEVGPGK